MTPIACHLLTCLLASPIGLTHAIVPTASLDAKEHATASTQTVRAPLLEHRELVLAMSRLASEHSQLASLLAVGNSHAGRKIEALRVAGGERRPGRPAILVVGNVDGPLVWTSGLVLGLARSLCEAYPNDAKVKELVDSTTLYFIPRANPDAAEARFTKPLFEMKATGHGVDNDRDGRLGEDGPSDVDGDGQVVWLRVRHPKGEWILDPADPRAMIKADAKKGERGIWRLFPEGRDSDHDEQVGEDPEFDAVVNQNFAYGWEAGKPEAGRYATDEPEARALCEFVLLHKDVALVLTYGLQDNLVEKPKSVGDSAPRAKLIPPEGTLESDADLYAELGKRYKKITGSNSKGNNDEHGSFQAWCQYDRGLWCLNIAPWSLPLDEPAPKVEGGPAGGEKKNADGEKKSAEADKKNADATNRGASGERKGTEGDASGDKKGVEGEKKSADTDKSDKDTGVKGDKPEQAEKNDKKNKEELATSDDAKRLRWIDAKKETARFVPWHAFHHPELGDVEIGGFAPYALVEPPAEEREKIAEKQFEFIQTIGALLPRVILAGCKAEELQGGLWRVKVALENGAFLPVRSASSRRADTPRPVRVTLKLPKEAQLLAGPHEELVRELAGSGGRKEFIWLFHGAPPAACSIEIDSDHAGSFSQVPEVK